MNRKVILVLLILVSITALSHASASDDVDIIASDEQVIVENAKADDAALDDDALQLDDQGNEDSLNEDYRNIQHEIDRAEENSTIILEGDYVCDYLINVNKTVKIVGNGNVTIKYNGSSNLRTPFFFINKTAPNVVLSNIKFIGGTFHWAGAIYWQGDNGTISGCEFQDNIATSDQYGIAGAVAIIADNCNVTNCIFSANQAALYGGALLCNGTGTLISNCEFRGNRAINEKSHGGAIVAYGSNNVIQNCNFTENGCNDYGGAISVLMGEDNIIRNCTFNDNEVTSSIVEDEYQGGGAVFSSSKHLTVDNCTFIGNLAMQSRGGAISLSEEDVVNGSYFRDNFALYGNDLAYLCREITYNHFVIDYNETLVKALDIKVNNLTDEDLFEAYLLASNNTIEKIKIDSSVVFSAGLVFKYGASGSIYVTVEGGIIELENIRVLNQPNARITFNNNLLTVSNLPVGKYILRVTTTPDENHTAVDGDLIITVNKATAVLSASKVTVALKSGSSWTIKIVDSRNNKPISGLKITLKVYTGKKYKTVTVTTNSNGVASYKTKSLSAGTHKVVASASHAGYNFNTVSSSIKVVKQTSLKFKLQLKRSDNGGALLSYMALNKKTKKGVNGIKMKVLIYTGKTYKTFILKTKKIKGKKKTYHGAFGFATNQFTAGKHKVVIMPESIKYKGSVKTSIVIKKSATKKLKFFRKI